MLFVVKQYFATIKLLLFHLYIKSSCIFYAIKKHYINDIETLQKLRQTVLVKRLNINFEGCARCCIPQRVPWTQTPFSQGLSVFVCVCLTFEYARATCVRQVPACGMPYDKKGKHSWDLKSQLPIFGSYGKEYMYMCACLFFLKNKLIDC